MIPLTKTKTKTHVTVCITSLMTSAKQLVFQDIQASRSLPKCSCAPLLGDCLEVSGGVLKMGGPQVVIIHIIGHIQ